MLEGINRQISNIHAANMVIKNPKIPAAEIGSFSYEETRPIRGYQITPGNYANRGVSVARVKTQDDLAEMELNHLLSVSDFPQLYYKGREID